MKLFSLFLSFAKVGVMTFGGGYAMIPILEREIVDKQGWASSEELMDYYAVGQCTPGVIAVNTATFIGYKVAGTTDRRDPDKFCRHPGCEERILSGPRLRLRPDFQRSAEALERRGKGQGSAGTVSGGVCPLNVL